MTNLTALRARLVAMLEAEGQTRSGEWMHGVSGGEGVVSYDQDDVEFVATFVNPKREQLAIAARNSFRPLLTLALGLIDACEACWDCNGTGEEESGACHCGDSMRGHSFYHNHSALEMTRECGRCAASRTLLKRLAEEIGE